MQSEGMPGDDWKRLAEHVVSRRVALGYKTRRQFADAVGVSARTLAELETGRPVSASTLAAVDNVLLWAPGSSRRTLRGGDPLPVNGQSGPPSDDHAVAEQYLLGELGPPSEGWNRVTTPEERRMFLAVWEARRGEQARQQQVPRDERRYGT